MKTGLIFLASMLWLANLFLMMQWRFSPACHGELKNNQRQGSWICRDARDHKSAELNYVDGKKEGVTHFWYADGNPDTTSTWKNGFMEGDFQSFHRNGKIHVRTNYLNGRFHGKLNEWNSRGQIITHCNYEMGLRQGFCRTWHANNQLASEINYKKNKAQPPIKFWNKSGVLQVAPQDFDQ